MAGSLIRVPGTLAELLEHLAWAVSALVGVRNQISTGVVSGSPSRMSLPARAGKSEQRRSSSCGVRRLGLALMWEKPSFFKSFPT